MQLNLLSSETQYYYSELLIHNTYNNAHRDTLFGFTKFYTLDRKIYAVRTGINTGAYKHAHTFVYRED